MGLRRKEPRLSSSVHRLGLSAGKSGLIVSCTNDGSNNVRVTCATPHGLVAFENVRLSGTTRYDGVTAVLNADDPAFFETGLVYSADTTGGRWAVV